MYRLPKTLQLKEKDSVIWALDKCVDDLNQSSEWLAHRRLTSPLPKYKLTRMRRNLKEIIEDIGRHQYIDSKGLLFYYNKTQLLPLKSHSIKKVVKNINFSIVYLNGISFPFKVSSAPLQRWARVVYRRGIPWFIYEFNSESKKPTKKKI